MEKIIKKVIKKVKTDEIKANEVKADATKKDIQETPEIYTDDLPTGKDIDIDMIKHSAEYIEKYFDINQLYRICSAIKEESKDEETISKEQMLTNEEYCPDIYMGTDSKEALKKFYKRNGIRHQLNLFRNDKGTYDIPKSFAKKIINGIDFKDNFKSELKRLNLLERKIDNDDYTNCGEYFELILRLREAMIESLNESKEDYTVDDIDLLIITYYDPYAILQEWKIRKFIHGTRMLVKPYDLYNYSFVDEVYKKLRNLAIMTLESVKDQFFDVEDNVSDIVFEDFINNLEKEYPEEHLCITEIYDKH